MEGEEKKGDVIEEVAVEAVDPIAEKDARILKLEEERDNYKAVALKRLGKLPGDSEFLGGNENGELSVAEQVRLALLDKEIESANRLKEEEVKRIQKENSELKLALKNRPGGSIGGESGSGVEVKDNVFSSEQLVVLKQKAQKLGVDPEKFIAKAKLNLSARR